MKSNTLRLERGIGIAVLGAVLALVLALTAAPARAAAFSNSTSIVVPATGTSGPSNPYPSAIAVSGLTGAITDVKATLTNMNHTFPGDLDILLVGPSGQNVRLLADTGGSIDITNATLTFEDSALTNVPATIVSGTYRPTGGVFNGPAPAPPSPYGTALAIFNGTVGNGTWNLYVYDQTGGDTGNIAGGWSLNITTNGPAITSFTPTTAPPGTQVVITGTNFTGATAVLFGGMAAATFTVNSATQITATVPTGATNGPISVTTPNGTSDSLTSFQVSPPPNIASFSPTSGKVGTRVIITGAELTGATAVRFGGTPAATFTINSATSITATVPAGAGTGPVSVTGPGGVGTSTARFVVRHARSLSLALSATKARGRLLANDGFTKAAANVRVRLQQRTSGGWKTIASDLTSANGRYSILGRGFSGRYRVLAPKTTLSTGDIALKALSPTVRR